MTDTEKIVLTFVAGAALTALATVAVKLIDLFPSMKLARQAARKQDLEEKVAREKSEAEKVKAKDEEIAALRARAEKAEEMVQDVRLEFIAWREAQLQPYVGRERRGRKPAEAEGKDSHEN